LRSCLSKVRKSVGGALSCRSSRRSAAGASGNGRARRQHHTSDRSRRRGLCPSSGGVAVAIAQGAVRLKVACDCLIGADGLRSFVRQRLHGDALRFSGRTAWRATVEAARVPVAMRRKETNLWLGRKAHLVHYPLRGGTIVNVVAIVDEDFHPDEKEFWSSPGEPGFLEPRFVRWTKPRGICSAPLLRGRNGRSRIAIQPQALSRAASR